jgi:hypothetical protein
MADDASTRLARELQAMGFSADLSRTAVERTRGQGLQAALDWLVASNLQEEQPVQGRPVPGLPLLGQAVRGLGVPAVPPMGALGVEQQMLQLALAESLRPTSVSTPRDHSQPWGSSQGWVPAVPAASHQLSEEEELQLALDASMEEDAHRRRQSQYELEEALAQVATARDGVAADTLPAATDMLDEGEPPSLPASLAAHDALREAAMLRRLEGGDCSPLLIAKAAVILRRRASMARTRSASQPPPGWPPGMEPPAEAREVEGDAPASDPATHPPTGRKQLPAARAATGASAAATDPFPPPAACTAVAATGDGAAKDLSPPAAARAAAATSPRLHLPEREEQILRGKQRLASRLRELGLEAVAVRDDVRASSARSARTATYLQPSAAEPSSPRAHACHLCTRGLPSLPRVHAEHRGRASSAPSLSSSTRRRSTTAPCASPWWRTCAPRRPSSPPCSMRTSSLRISRA